jgi:hypothetical protein
VQLFARLVLIALSVSAVSISGCTRWAKHQLKIDGLPADIASVNSYTVNVTNASGTIEVLTKPSLKTPWVQVKRSRPRPGADMAGPGKHPEQYSNATFSEADGMGTLTVVSSAGDVSTPGEWVRISIWVPSLTDVKIRNSGGHVLVRNARGTVDIQNATTRLGSGTISYASTFPVKSTFMLSTDEGDIDAAIPPASDVKLELTAGGGTASVAARNVKVIGAIEKGSEWTGVINAGAAPATLRTGKGNIKVRIGASEE